MNVYITCMIVAIVLNLPIAQAMDTKEEKKDIVVKEVVYQEKRNNYYTYDRPCKNEQVHGAVIKKESVDLINSTTKKVLATIKGSFEEGRFSKRGQKLLLWSKGEAYLYSLHYTSQGLGVKAVGCWSLEEDVVDVLFSEDEKRLALGGKMKIEIGEKRCY
jgi:hypothetical protein